MRLARIAAKKTGLRPIEAANPPKGSSISNVVSAYTLKCSAICEKIHAAIIQRQSNNRDCQTHRKTIQKLTQLKHPDVALGCLAQRIKGKIQTRWHVCTFGCAGRPRKRVLPRSLPENHQHICPEPSQSAHAILHHPAPGKGSIKRQKKCLQSVLVELRTNK